MAIVVVHRYDLLLQRNVAEDLRPELVDTYIGRVTHPHHVMLLRFLNERLAGHRFESFEELKHILAGWPRFAKENGLEVNDDWNELSLYQSATDLLPDIFCGSLMIAHILTA